MSDEMTKPITRDKALQLLDEINRELNNEGIYATMDIYGGVVMMVSFMPQYSSVDFDARFSDIAYDSYQKILKTVGERNGLGPGWVDESVCSIINDDMKIEKLTKYSNFSNLTVRFPIAEQLLAMKLFAARLADDRHDLSHAALLCKELGIKTRNRMEEVLKIYFKEDSIKHQNRQKGRHNCIHDFMTCLVEELKNAHI